MNITIKMQKLNWNCISNAFCLFYLYRLQNLIWIIFMAVLLSQINCRNAVQIERIIPAKTEDDTPSFHTHTQDQNRHCLLLSQNSLRFTCTSISTKETRTRRDDGGLLHVLNKNSGRATNVRQVAWFDKMLHGFRLSFLNLSHFHLSNLELYIQQHNTYE